MASNSPSIVALRSALRELRGAPLLAKGQHAETVAALSLVLLEEFDRRISALEARLVGHDARLHKLSRDLDAIGVLASLGD